MFFLPGMYEYLDTFNYEKSLPHIYKKLVIRNTILLTFFYLVSWQLAAQPYYINSTNGLELVTISGSSCSSQFIGEFVDISTGNPVGSGDIAVCPDGSMYIAGAFQVWEVNPTTAGCTLIASASSSTVIVALGCAGGGLLYGAGFDFSQGNSGKLFEIDASAGTVTIVGDLPFNPAGDIVNYNGTWYLAANEGIVEVNINNPELSTLVLASESYVAMTVFNDGCNTLLGGNGSDLTLIDLETGLETPLCTLPTTIGGLTTSGEFDPPNVCSTILDLDEDDSTGAPDYDYNAEDFNCLTTSGVQIADIDPYIESPDLIEQMSISIVGGIQDFGNEFLELLNAPNIQISGSGTTSLVLLNSGNASINDFLTAINNTTYQNNATTPTPGLREVQAFFTTTTQENSNFASAFINVIQLPDVPVDLGPDIEICPNDITTLDAGSGTGYTYSWSTFETTQIIQVIGAGDFSVTVSDGLNCPGNDTIQLVQLPEYTVSLNGVSEICETEITAMTIETNAPGLIDVVINDGVGPPLEFFNISSGFSFLVTLLETTTYSITTANPVGFSGCLELGNPLTIDVFPVYLINESVSICQGESILLGGENQTTAGIYATSLLSENGCDSTIIIDLSVLELDTTNLAATTCLSNEEGVFIETVDGTNGCDSVIISTITYSPPDTTLSEFTTCDTSLVGTFQETFQNQQGCDSLVITTINFSALDTTIINDTSCNPNEVGVTELLLLNSEGCDSLVITVTTLLATDTTYVELTSCNPVDTGTVVTLLTNQAGCDSLLIETTSLLPSDISYLEETTCDPSVAGIDTLALLNQFACDSLIVINTVLTSADTTFLNTTSCDPIEIGIDTTIFSTAFCDSIVITTTILLTEDTTFIELTSCNLVDTGTVVTLLTNQGGCDSLVIETTSLLPSDISFLEETTCDPSAVGIDTLVLLNQFACDSLIVINTVLTSADTTFLNTTSCDPTEAGTDTTIFSTAFCDSIVITTTILLPEDTTFIELTSCNSLDTGTVVTLLTNQAGCDSLIFETTSFISSIEISTITQTDFNGFDVSCAGAIDGQASVNIDFGGVPPFSYEWSSGQVSADIDNIGAGTYFVTITDSQGCTGIATLEMIEPPEISVDFLVDDLSCFGENDGSILVTNTSGGNDTYLFALGESPFQSTGEFYNLSPGTYLLNTQDINGCTVTDTLLLNSPNELVVELGEDKVIQLGESVELSAVVNISESFISEVTWNNLDSLACSFCLQQSFTPLATSNYSVTVTDQNGCRASDSQTVIVEKSRPVYIPTAFSPNGDGINDQLIIYGQSRLIEEVISFQIFDRWGEEVFNAKNFQPNNPNDGWDGYFKNQPMNNAVFVYFAKIKFIDGYEELYSGEVNLLR